MKYIIINIIIALIQIIFDNTVNLYFSNKLSLIFIICIIQLIFMDILFTI